MHSKLPFNANIHNLEVYFGLEFGYKHESRSATVFLGKFDSGLECVEKGGRWGRFSCHWGHCCITSICYILHKYFLLFEGESGYRSIWVCKLKCVEW